MRDQKRNVTGAWKRVLKHWRNEAKKNDGILTCALCGKPIIVFAHEYPDPQSLTIDHKTPWILGGEDTIEGSQPTHASCNWSRSDGPSNIITRNSRKWF